MLKRIQSLLIKKPMGFSLVETLLFSSVVSIILLGTLKLMGISAQSVKVNKISHVEGELEGLIRKGIMNESDCIYNLGHTQLNGTPLQGMGTIANLRRPVSGGDVLLFSTGQNIKDSLEIVKMELTGANPMPASSPVERFFTVYYKKLGAGALNTLGGGSNCSSSNVSDCYFKHYKLAYRIDNRVGYGNMTTKCTVSVCTQGACCYTVDRLDETQPIENPSANAKGRSAIGCRGASNISKSRTVAFGFLAGAGTAGTGIAGHSNVFMGYRAGQYSTADYDPTKPDGSGNVIMGSFIGRQAYPLPPPDRGYSNIFIGSFISGDIENTTGSKNIFLGKDVGNQSTEGSSNIFIGEQAGYDLVKSEENIFIGNSAGEHVGLVSDGNLPPPPIRGNIYIGYQAGIGRGIIPNNTYGIPPTTHSNIGQYNTFIGKSTGVHNAEGSHNIYIGRKAGPLRLMPPPPPPLPPATPPAGLTDGDHLQLNIGHLILGRMPDPLASPHPLQNSPDIPDTTDPDDGVVINGDLKIRGNIEHQCHPGPCIPVTMNIGSKKSIMYAFNPTSSKEYKKNIKTFKNYEKALEDIINTPLFTYEYKKDRPEKSRMGIISEELPTHLQLEEVDPRLRGDDNPKKVSMPDWPSVYGTFWAGIKALFIQFKSFKEKILVELSKIKEIGVEVLKIADGNKNTLDRLNPQIKNTTQMTKRNTEENTQQKKQFVQIKTKLETTKKKLQTIKQKLQKLRDSVAMGAVK